MASKAKIWQYFENTGTCDAKCNICDRVIKRNGNTTNLVSHLRSKHSIQYKIYLTDQSNARTHTATASTTITKDSGIEDTAKKSQRKLTSFVTLPLSKSREQDITNSIVDWIAKDGLPIYTVEKTGYKQMMEVLERRYQTPSRKTVMRKLSDKYDATCKELHQYINQHIVKQRGFCSITTDMWSSSSMDPYMAVTLHFITEAWELKSKLLQCSYLPGSHTGELIAEAIMDSMYEWGLTSSTNIGALGAALPHLSAVVSDNGANIVRAANILNAQRVPCFGHCLNLAVHNGLKDERIHRATAAVRKLCGHFAHSSQRQEQLQSVQAELNMNLKKLKNDCETRWNSTFSMVDRVLEQKDALARVLSDRKGEKFKLSWQTLDVLESLKTALEPLAPLTDALSGEHVVTVSEILPVLDSMTTHLQHKDEDTALSNEIRQRVVDNMFSRYQRMGDISNSEDYLELDSLTQILLISTFLDPRYKGSYCDKDLIIALLLHASVGLGNLVERPESDCEQSVDIEEPPTKIRKSVLQSFIVSRASQSPATATSLGDRVQREIDIYLSSPAMSTETPSVILVF